jgi:predicted small metal-binding protein
MPKDTKKDAKKKSTTADTAPQSGGINPSAPASGTEGWGQTSDERRVLSSSDPKHTRAGQMKGNPGDHMRAASQREEDRATSNKKRSSHQDDNQADLSHRTSASAYSMNTSHGGQDHTFRCADMGNAGCRWETSGSTEDEVMRHVEEHGRRDHGMADWTQAMRSKVRDAIRHRNAA